MEAFKGVVWPRQVVNGSTFEFDGQRLYRYAIVGVVVSDQPCPELERLTESLGRTSNEAILCGRADGLLDALARIPRGEMTYQLGDATSVLCSLNSIKPKV